MTVYYFHNDSLGTPVRLTNQRAVTVWMAEYRPFGDIERLETDSDGDGVNVEQPLRFPGQSDDALSSVLLAQGPYYNFNRHYEPATGRYLSQEPMLQEPAYIRWVTQAGRTSPTYTYAGSNPLYSIDPTGLLPDVPCPSGIDCLNLGNFEPAGGTTGVPQRWDPNAPLPPARGAPTGTPILEEDSPMMKECLRKCRTGRGRELMERTCAGRVSDPQAFRECIKDILKMIERCEKDCRAIVPGELTCR